MSLKSYWAYAFTCATPLGAMIAAWNESGPWEWQMRDSHWYGDYLNCRPMNGVRVRIHEPATEHSAYGADDPKARGRYTALMEIEGGSAATQSQVDEIVRRLLSAVGAGEPETIAPYD